MFPLKNRLRKKEEFNNVYRRGKVFIYGNIGVSFTENNLEYSRIGFVVSGKFSKKAVERNKIRRQLRAIFQKKMFILKSGIDLVVTPKKREKTSFQKLQETVEKTLKKAKIIS